MATDDLLVGPRGRHLCMAVARRLNQDVWSAWWLASNNSHDAARRQILLHATGRIDVTAVHLWQDPPALVGPMGEAVGAVMYWQPPHDQDSVAAHPDVAQSLRPVAAALTASPASAWWTTPVDLSALHYTELFQGQENPEPPTLAGAAEKLGRGRTDTLADERDAARNRPADPAAPFSGHWWFTLRWHRCSPRLARLDSIEIAWREDGIGHANAAVWTLKTTQAPRSGSSMGRRHGLSSSADTQWT